MTEKRMPAAERQRETGTRWLSPSSWSSWITGRIPGLVPGRESALTRSGEPVKRKMTMTPEPTDKLVLKQAISGARRLVHVPDGSDEVSTRLLGVLSSGPDGNRSAVGVR